MRSSITKLLLTITACSPVLATAQIKVGLVGPLSGGLAPFGVGMTEAAKQAVKESNAKAPKDRQIELLFEDDACDPKQGTAVAQKLVDSKVQYVVGHACTAGPSASIYSESKVLFIAIGDRMGKVLIPANPMAFRMQASSLMTQSIAQSAKMADLHKNGFALGDCPPLESKGVRLSARDKTISGKDREPDTPIICPLSPVSPVQQPQALRQMDLSKKLGGVDPWASQTYAAVQMLSVALQSLPKAPVEKVSEYLRKTAIKTDLGTLQFTSSGLLSKQSMIIYMPKSNDPKSLDSKLPSSVSATASDDPANDPTHPKSNCTKKSCTTEEVCDTDKDGNKTNCKQTTKCEYTC